MSLKLRLYKKIKRKKEICNEVEQRNGVVTGRQKEVFVSVFLNRRCQRMTGSEGVIAELHP